MADKWEQYAVPSAPLAPPAAADKWAQYAEPAAVPGNTPAERTQYLRAHPDAAAANREATAMHAQAPEGSALSRLGSGLISPITGPAREIWQFVTDHDAWVKDHLGNSTNDMLSVPLAPQAGQAATGDVAGAVGSAVGQAGLIAAQAKAAGPALIDQPGAPGAPAIARSLKRTASAATNPEVVKAGIKVLPKGAAAVSAWDAFQRARTPEAPPAPEPPGFIQGGEPSQLATESAQQYQARLNGQPPPAAPAAKRSGMPMNRDARRATTTPPETGISQAEQQAQIARDQRIAASGQSYQEQLESQRAARSAPAPVRAPGPIDTGPVTGGGPSIAEQLRADVEAKKAAAPAPVPDGLPTLDEIAQGYKFKSFDAAPADVQKSIQSIHAAFRRPVETAAPQAAPVEAPQAAPAPVEAPPAPSATAEMTPPALETPRSQFTAAGEQKSPQLRGAETMNGNIEAKATRWANALQAEGVTAEDLGNIHVDGDWQKLLDGLHAKGVLPEGETIPDQSRPVLIERLRAMEAAPKTNPLQDAVARNKEVIAGSKAKLNGKGKP